MKKFIIELKSGKEYVSDQIECNDLDGPNPEIYEPESAIDVLIAEYVELTTKVGGLKVAFRGDEIRVVTGPVE